MSKEIVFLTGVSSGFGLESLLLLSQNGYFVIGTVRSEAKRKELLSILEDKGLKSFVDIYLLDITEDEQVIQVVKQVINKYKTIDILINNAGYCLGGFSEELSLEEYRKQFETNVFGSISVTKAFLPYMRENNKGKILFISSILGQISVPSMSAYVSSKYALEGFAECLRLELLCFNIQVSIIEPGSYQTGIWKKGLENLQENESSPYNNQRTFISGIANKEVANSGNPKEVAELVLSLCNKRTIGIRYIVGLKIRLASFLFKFIPRNVLEFFLKTICKEGKR